MVNKQLLTGLDVKTGNEHSKQSSNGDRTCHLAVTEEGTKSECALAQVSDALCYPHTE